jgi:ribosomal protein L3
MRTGVLAKKLGMTQTWTEWGERIPITLLQVCAPLSLSLDHWHAQNLFP